MELKFDRKLTPDPSTGHRIPLDTANDARNYVARQQREYAAATQELIDAPSEVALAWIERIRLDTSWMDTPEFRKATGRSALANFVGVFVSLTGLYPSKIDALGLSFSSSTHAGFIVALIGLIWYEWASVMVLKRNFIIASSLIELEHKVSRKFRDFESRWANFIRWQHAEKSFFYMRLPGFITFTSILCLLVSLIRSLIAGV